MPCLCVLSVSSLTRAPCCGQDGCIHHDQLCSVFKISTQYLHNMLARGVGPRVSSAVPHPHHHLSSLHWSRLIADPAQVMKLRGYEDARRDSAIGHFIFHMSIKKDGFQTFLLLDLYLFCQGHLSQFFINLETHFDYCFCWFLVHFSLCWL